MVLGRRRDPGPPSWEDVRKRTLAVYSTERGGRSRAAVLVWQGDEPRVAVRGILSPFLAFTMDVETEADADNAVTLTGFPSLEAARVHCVDWVGDAGESHWDALGEAAQVGVYAAIREPSFAGDS
jgi:hypothetical protein